MLGQVRRAEWTESQVVKGVTSYGKRSSRDREGSASIFASMEVGQGSFEFHSASAVDKMEKRKNT